MKKFPLKSGRVWPQHVFEVGKGLEVVFLECHHHGLDQHRGVVVQIDKSLSNLRERSEEGGRVGPLRGERERADSVKLGLNLAVVKLLKGNSTIRTGEESTKSGACLTARSIRRIRFIS